MTPEDVLRRVENVIVGHPGRVVVAFLLVSTIFAGGLANVSTEAGTQQFASDIPANNALERINDEFSPRFGEDVGSTQLVQRAPNVLAKPELLRMLRAQERLESRTNLRVSSTSSAAAIVAREIDPSATTLEAQIDTIERAPESEVRRAVRAAADEPAFSGTLSDDFNRESASASATIGVVQHTLPAGLDSSSAGQGGSSPLTPIQLQAERVVATVGGDITVFGSGIISEEFSQVITDSLLIVTPAAVIFILLFLIVAYRDLVDLLLGTFALFLALVWTFGFLGLAGIPFNQIMIAVPPLLLAIGIDFGIHAVNRYREDRAEGHEPGEAMRLASRQLLVAFFIVTGTTVIGFLANYVSDLPPIRDFGIVAAVGIVFVFAIFGVFLPALKLYVDRLRQRYPIPTFSEAPLGTEGSALGRVLEVGVDLARFAPVVVLLIALVGSAGAGYYATGVDTTFTQEDFLPPEETPPYLASLPEPFAPGDYSVVATINFLEDKFTASQGDATTVYLTGRLERDTALEEIHRAGRDPPESFVSENRQAQSTSLVTVVQDRAASDPEFRALVARNDRDGNGIPDDDLDQIYAYLESSSSAGRLSQYLDEDHRSSRVVYQTEADASQDQITEDTRAVAQRFRFGATATGSVVVFKAISDVIFESAIQSLIIALGGTAVFLFLIYGVLEGRPSLGLANLVPIVIAVSLVAGSMRVLGISFNAFTATILALTIGLGIDYSVHVVHRFVDERREHDLYTALGRTVRGTGGALAGSMLTTAFGIGVLTLAVLSVLGQFGVLTALSIVYSFLASMLVLPSALVVWDRATGNDPDAPIVPRHEDRSWADDEPAPGPLADVDRPEPLAPDRDPVEEGEGA